MIVLPASSLPVVWRKSRRSNPSGNCVELGEMPDGFVAIRDSQDPDGPAFTFRRGSVAEFLAGVRADRFRKD